MDIYNEFFSCTPPLVEVDRDMELLWLSTQTLREPLIEEPTCNYAPFEQPIWMPREYQFEGDFCLDRSDSLDMLVPQATPKQNFSPKASSTEEETIGPISQEFEPAHRPLESAPSEVSHEESKPLSHLAVPLRKNKKTGYVKSDQGFKTCMRAFRKALKKAFKAAGFGKGRHHWTPARWVDEITLFAAKRKDLNFTLTIEDKYALWLLLYPAFGNTAKKQANPEVFRELGSTQALREERLRRYHTVFETNNSQSRNDFFSDSLIRKIWAVAVPNMTREVCFREGAAQKEKDIASFSHVTLVVTQRFDLDMPLWWKCQFPPK